MDAFLGEFRHLWPVFKRNCTLYLLKILFLRFELTVVVELALDLRVVLELQVVLTDRNRTHLPRVAGAALCRGLRVRLYHLQIRAIYLIIYS